MEPLLRILLAAFQAAAAEIGRRLAGGLVRPARDQPPSEPVDRDERLLTQAERNVIDLATQLRAAREEDQP